MDFSAANGLIPALAWGATSLLKNVLGDLRWFQRFLPLIPVVLSFILAFIPGIGPEGTVGAKILFAAAAGGLAGTAHEVTKRTVRGKGLPGGGWLAQ